MSFALRRTSLRGSLGIATALGMSLGVAMSSIALAQAPSKPAPSKPTSTAQPNSPTGQQQGKPAAPATTNQAGQQQAKPTAPAAANPAEGPTIVTVKGAASAPEWIKQCAIDESVKARVCLTARDFVSDNEQPALSIAVYEITPENSADPKADKQKKYVLRLLMPLGLYLEPGIRFSVDSSGFVAGKFQVCVPQNGCIVEIQAKEDLLNSMRNGKTFNVSAQNYSLNMAERRPLVFAVPADGFGKTFEGAAIDPKVLAEQQQKMDDDLQRQSAKMREELMKRGETGVPVPAPNPAPEASAAPAAKP